MIAIQYLKRDLHRQVYFCAARRERGVRRLFCVIHDKRH
jgi:hypothetical protein